MASVLIDSAPFRRVALRAAPFPLRAVRLFDGPLRERQDLHARHLAAIDPDRLLAPFRAQAGLAPRAGDVAGAVYGLCLMRADAAAACDTEPRVVFKGHRPSV